MFDWIVRLLGAVLILLALAPLAIIYTDFACWFWINKSCLVNWDDARVLAMMGYVTVITPFFFYLGATALE